jgi:hypothetical protein
MNKTPYFNWPLTPCLHQQPHENKNRLTCHPHTQISFNSSTVATENNTGMYIIHYSIEHCIFCRLYIINNTCNFNLIYRYSLTVKTLKYYSVMVTGCCSYRCFVLLKMGDNDIRNMYSNHQIKINSVTCASCWDFYIGMRRAICTHVFVLDL